jgi:membrane-bound serine protease (ClpP class)
MKLRLASFLLWALAGACAAEETKRVYILPIRDEIEQSMAYLVRRGVKEAMDMKADALILHMDTPGGRGDSMKEIMEAVSKFEPRNQTYTLVDKEAFSAGAFISACTRSIFMTPGSTIGAASPVVMGSDGGSPQELPPKFVSAYASMIRAAAEQNGHNPEVFDAMVNKQRGLMIEGKEIVAKGDILTLTTEEAVRPYGKVPKPLLSQGTVKDLNTFIRQIGGDPATAVTLKPTGFEQVARLITMAAPFLMMLGMLLGYLEFKTPGFGLFGMGAALCFAIFFFGHYIAGLTGYEPLLLFGAGVLLIVVELFLFPGIILPALTGVALIAAALLYSMVDRYPGDPVIPTVAQLQGPTVKLMAGFAFSLIGIALLGRYLPKRVLYSDLEAATIGGPSLPRAGEIKIGDQGLALTLLRPSGTAQFDGRPVDVVTEGGLIEKGAYVKVIQVEGFRIVVEPV